MYRLTLGLVLVATVGLGEWPAPPQGVPPDPAAAVQDRDPAEVPPPPLVQGDPADSVYRAARDAMTRRDFGRAAELFAQVPTRFPKSAYAADAFYWQAFALYRLGGDAQLHQALAALRSQRERFPKAATQGDAAALERRVQGVLARRGDPESAAEVAAAAAEAAEPGDIDVPDPGEPDDESHEGGCRDDGDDMKLAALNALIHMDSERARPILSRVLARRDAGSVCLRRKAVFLFAQSEGAGTENLLLATARTDPDREVREQAVFWLSQVGSEQAVGALDSILRTSTDRGLQEKALFALSQHDSPRARQALRTYAERADLPEETREKAIFWIGQSGEPEDATYLRALYGRITGPELRKKVLFSVSQIGGAESARWLLGIARNGSEPLEMRKQALFWAGQGGASIGDLVALYGSMPDREMREQLLFVYSQRDESAAVDKLLDVARREPDAELRKKALFWLGQIDDPRAAKALQEIIEQP